MQNFGGVFYVLSSFNLEKTLGGAVDGFCFVAVSLDHASFIVFCILRQGCSVHWSGGFMCFGALE